MWWALVWVLFATVSLFTHSIRNHSIVREVRGSFLADGAAWQVKKQLPAAWNGSHFLRLNFSAKPARSWFEGTPHTNMDKERWQQTSDTTIAITTTTATTTYQQRTYGYIRLHTVRYGYIPLAAAFSGGHVVGLGQRLLRLGRLQLLPLLDLVLHFSPPLPPLVPRGVGLEAVRPRGQAHLLVAASSVLATKVMKGCCPRYIGMVGVALLQVYDEQECPCKPQRCCCCCRGVCRLMAAKDETDTCMIWLLPSCFRQCIIRAI